MLLKWHCYTLAASNTTPPVERGQWSSLASPYKARMCCWLPRMCSRTQLSWFLVHSSLISAISSHNWLNCAWYFVNSTILGNSFFWCVNIIILHYTKAYYCSNWFSVIQCSVSIPIFCFHVHLQTPSAPSCSPVTPASSPPEAASGAQMLWVQCGWQCRISRRYSEMPLDEQYTTVDI